ncbi:MAG: hypothetical protein JW860_06640, partial [Sedimentisphaerales bacterium]|nr:hypothetical protein [Sedimentisphaerales bacterium]
IPEVIGPAGRTFDPYSIDDMTQSITQALTHDIDNPQHRLTGLQQAKKFSEQKTAQLTYQVYESVAH